MAGIIVNEINRENNKAKITHKAKDFTNSPVFPGSKAIGIKVKILVKVDASKGMAK